MEIRRPTPHPLVVLLVLPLLAACETEPEPAPMDAPPPTDPAPEAAPPEPELDHDRVQIEPVGDSQVRGEAIRMEEEDQMVVVVEVAGLPQEGEYPIHIHAGSCAEGGPVDTPLNPVIGQPDGTGSSTTTLELADMDEADNLFINLHDPEGEPIACGDIS